MKGNCVMSIKTVFCSLLLLGFLAMCQAQDQPNRARLLKPGIVLQLPLSEFAPDSDQKAYDLLNEGQFNAALTLFKQEVAQNGNDLAAFVCLTQLDSEYRRSQILRLDAENLAGRLDAVSLFKLGALHYYNAKMVYLSQSNVAAAQELTEAHKLLQQAWQQNPDPVVGTVYVEASQMPAPHLMLERQVLDQLIKELSGQQAYSTYRHAEQFGWHADVPLTQHTPPLNLKPLRGVIRLAKSLSSARIGHGVMTGNRIEVTYDPVAPEEVARGEYLAKWRAALDKALQSAHS
jgi:tetratricopeptide (TPR) repeat protein